MIIDDIRKGQNGNQQAVVDLINKFSPALKNTHANWKLKMPILICKRNSWI